MSKENKARQEDDNIHEKCLTKTIRTYVLIWISIATTFSIYQLKCKKKHSSYENKTFEENTLKLTDVLKTLTFRML